MAEEAPGGSRPSRRYRPEPVDRERHARRAVALFNAGDYWEAHEELEVIWRSIPDAGEALVVQGLIQAAAALLHQARGNRHGLKVVGRAALQKLAGRNRPAIEFETEAFRDELARALEGPGSPPMLRLREP